MANWRYVLTDQNFVPQGEILNAGAQKISIPLSKLDTASFTLRLDNPLTDLIAAEAGGYIKAYRNGSLLFYGPIVTAEEVGDGLNTSLAVNAFSSGWIFSKRFIGKSARGNETYASSATDRGLIIGGFLDALNAENYTHVRRSATMTSASVVTYVGGPYAFMSQCISDLSNSFDGFDWRVIPVENFVNGAVVSPAIGELYTNAVIGIQQPEAVFEWGVGRHNVASYRRTVGRETQADKVYHNASAGPDAPGYPTVSASNSAAIAKWGLLEDMASGDLTDSGLRTSLVQEHVNVRSSPRRIITFVPHLDDGTGRVPQYGVDYTVGDAVRARAQFNGVIRFDGMFRVWGVDFDIDANGTERITLTLEDSS